MIGVDDERLADVELLGDIATQALVPRAGRADDFAWPRGNAADEPATILPATAMTPAGLIARAARA